MKYLKLNENKLFFPPQILEPNSLSNLRIIFGLFFPKIFKFFKFPLFKRSVASFYTNITQQTINYRKLNSINRNDFFQLFMQLHDQGQEITMNQVTANAFLFVLAGYETSASTLTFCLYEISKNQEIQRKIQKEIDGLGNNFDYEKYSDLKFTEKCIEETLRKYPIIPMLNRVCEHDYDIKEVGLTIPKGTSLFFPLIGYHRDPEMYENPLEFNPERNFSHSMPFGTGQRSCPGNRMAMLVIKLTVVKILSKYNLQLVQPTTPEVTFNPKIAPLSSKEKILIKFSHR